MEWVTDPLHMVMAFGALLLTILAYEAGSLIGARHASKEWTVVTGIALEELASARFSEELARLRRSVESSRGKA